MQSADSQGPSAEEEFGTRATLDGVATVQEVNFDDIKYQSFDDYLNTTEYKLDKSGLFTKIQMPQDKKLQVSR